MAEQWFDETLYPMYRQGFLVRELTAVNTGLQELKILENARFGRILTLDGVIQVTEGDEFVYHEMLTHVPILAHGAARQVLILGGGDGGILREALRHRAVARATMVEIDRGVVDFSKQQLPGISAGAFDDKRLDLVIDDAATFVRETDRRYDVIIVDSTDPVGPAAVLFAQDFYADCKRCLSPGGIMVTQNGVPFLQPEELATTWRRLSPLFPDASFYMAAVPTYVGGVMALGWASLDPGQRIQPLDAIQSRYKAAGLRTRYYNPEIHVAAFALPNYVRALMR